MSPASEPRDRLEDRLPHTGVDPVQKMYALRDLHVPEGRLSEALPVRGFGSPLERHRGADRLDEIAEILATALVRLMTREAAKAIAFPSATSSAAGRDQVAPGLAVSANQSVHVLTRPGRARATGGRHG